MLSSSFQGFLVCLFFFVVILRLRVPELIIFSAFIGKEPVVRADLNNGAVIEQGNLVAKAAGGKPVTYIDRCPICHHLAESRIYLGFGNGVESRRRLIENDKRSVFIKRAGNGDFLRFATRNVHAVFIEVLIKICVKPLRHFFGVEDKARFFKAGIDLFRDIA